MTEEEKVAADAAQAKADAEAKKAEPKNYSEEEFKKVVGDRDKAKKELKEIRDAEEKAKADKLKADGEYKTLLDQKETELAEKAKLLETLQASADASKAKEEKLKTDAIGKLKDPTLKDLATKLSDVNDVLKFVELHTGNKSPTFDGKLRDGDPAKEDFAYDPKKYPDFASYQRAARKAGLAL